MGRSNCVTFIYISLCLQLSFLERELEISLAQLLEVRIVNRIPEANLPPQLASTVAVTNVTSEQSQGTTDTALSKEDPRKARKKRNIIANRLGVGRLLAQLRRVEDTTDELAPEGNEQHQVDLRIYSSNSTKGIQRSS